MKLPRLGILFLIIAAVLSAAACNSSHYTIQTDSKFRKKTETVTRSIQVSREMDNIILELKGKLNRGKMTWKLTDPAEAVRWEEEVDGAFNKLKTFKAVDGEWNLLIEFYAAAGKYSMQWTAQ
ncbi:MAG: hypothetical protein E4H36_03145 [Spirochaetales bacterium]|nr:MAG: hypothetical protein E4H36_03145 [Spirochaetales bacterium]